MNNPDRVGSAPRPIRPAALTGGSALVVAAFLSFAPAKSAMGATEMRTVADFDEVVLAAAGEVSIEQGSAETLDLEAEPAVLRMITPRYGTAGWSWAWLPAGSRRSSRSG